MRAPLVPKEWRRQTLVDVLRRVHDDRKVRRGGGKRLPGGEAVRLLVHVEEVGPGLTDEARERTGLGIHVTVDVTGAPRRELDHGKRLCGQSGLGVLLRPRRGHDERHVDPCREQGALAGPVGRVTAAVVDAQHPHVQSTASTVLPPPASTRS